jgi:hypothetical protein
MSTCHDNTALNSIEIICRDNSTIKSTEGTNGIWRIPYYCPKGSNLSGFQLRSQPSPGIQHAQMVAMMK